ncbi:MAG: LamG domain-containing protein [Akkermansiaceae bacterium]|jgi:hypothetical protein|nr:LamG domain-containing protein [Akkermansiaceae bacterium]
MKKLALIAIPLGIGTASAALTSYTADANTIYLYHFNESSGATSATNSGTAGFAAIAFDGNPAANNATNPQALNSSILGSSGFSGFGNSANISAADLGMGVDANSSGGFQMGLNGGASPDAVTHGSFASGNGSFSVDAMIQVSSITGTNRQIVSTDNSLGNTARGFQFRLTSGGAMEFNFIGTNTSTSTIAIPTSGTHGFVANEWFHVALTFDGATNTSSFYWTRVDAVHTAANLLGVSTNETVNNSIAGPIVIGNEGRSFGTGANSTEGLLGRIDEVRISNVVRGADQFIFVPEPSVTLLGALGALGLLRRRR